MELFIRECIQFVSGSHLNLSHSSRFSGIERNLKWNVNFPLVVYLSPSLRIVSILCVNSLINGDCSSFIRDFLPRFVSFSWENFGTHVSPLTFNIKLNFSWQEFIKNFTCSQYILTCNDNFPFLLFLFSHYSASTRCSLPCLRLQLQLMGRQRWQNKIGGDAARPALPYNIYGLMSFSLQNTAVQIIVRLHISI